MSSRRRKAKFWLLLKSVVQRLFRTLLWLQRRRNAQTGFVFPITTLLVLMMLLTASALTYRTFSRSQQAIAQREQQVIINTATPAIDRAKSKIEFMFQRDPRFPQGLPSSDYLVDMMAVQADAAAAPFAGYTGRVFLTELSDPAVNPDPYTLSDETRLDLNNDNTLDNAWSFPVDMDGDGTVGDGVVVYSILMDDEGPNIQTTVTLDAPQDNTKADSLVTRTGPLATTEVTDNCPGARTEAGWQVAGSNNSILQKNFQVNAFVANTNNANQTFETLEFQQSRVADRANKWGAWFRYDLDIFPFANFNWNGAMHTDGNLMVADSLTSYMVSSQNSCVYNQQASEITLGRFDNDGDDVFDPEAGDFVGQAVNGKITDDSYGSGSPGFHVWFTNDNTEPQQNNTLTAANDSVNNGSPSDVAMNPIALFTEDEELHMNPAAWERVANWEPNAANPVVFVERRRIVNDDTSRPFVDDFFRADNRWGPKPRYQVDEPTVDVAQVAEQIGDDISGLPELTDDTEGLDGYWERQAIASGLRLIVGQRLELGNANGWNSDPTTGSVAGANQGNGDALYPHQASRTDLSGNTRVGGNHEYLQRKSLRDNLAAVQGMVAYHYEINSGEFPAACLAMTAHPGTIQSIINSRTFEPLILNAAPTAGQIKANFLRGGGTNGWEFAYNGSYDTPGEFTAGYNGSGALNSALENLAHFAGDPNGGAPSFPPVQDGFVHPFPYLSMWGDFSGLRNIIDSGTAYDALSFADQATLHSAACSLSLLAYNLDSLETEFNDITNAQWQGMAADLLALVTDTAPPGANEILDADAQSTPAREWIRAAAATGSAQALLDRMEIAADFWQVQRDRTFGFNTDQGLEAAAGIPPFGAYNQQNATFNLVAPVGTYTAGSYSVSCDPNFFNTVGIGDTEQALTLALALCPTQAPNANDGTAKYPSLYYLFPRAAHNQQTTATITGINNTAQPTDEEYIDATAAAVPSLITDYVVNFNYQVVDPAALAAVPRVPGGANPWVLPFTTDGGATLEDSNNNRPDDRPFAINNPAGGVLNVTFLDKGIADGREQLSVRVLDVDLDAITTQRTSGGDYWLPTDPNKGAEGVVYAFREDAVREDEIVRPGSGTTAATCATPTAGNRFNLDTDGGCLMQARPVGATPGPQDPPLTDENISLKPVDFIADPERRPYGFRLRTASGNPADFSNGLSADRAVGMTLITDNGVYIQGDFNLHSTANTVATRIEEFGTPLANNFSNFYARTQPDNDDFTDLTIDRWRPVELLCDAVTILSENFRDGAILDTFTEQQPAARGGATSSYMNLNRPDIAAADPWDDPDNWVHEDNVDLTSPIWIDRNGTFYTDNTPPGVVNSRPYFAVFTAANDWIELDEDAQRRNNLQQAVETFVNATFVSGIVPKRPNQSYGGLHNYPRFLEFWGGDNPTPLNISGSFIQLNFSTGATGPYEHDAWEPGNNPTAAENVFYYGAPLRRWGYDVGLLYVPPPPAARRFVSINTPRNEYYREISSDDPYIMNLRCAEDSTGNRVVLSTDAAMCP